MITSQHRRPRLTRRGFLVASGVTGAAGVTGSATWAALSSSSGRRSAAPSASSSDGTLVLLTLYGGNDGLDTVVPIGDPAYARARGDAAVDPAKALPLADGLALHPSLGRLKRRYDAGTVAVISGVGYPQPDHSHFRSMAIWQTASPQTASTTGWLGRWLDATAGAAAQLGGPIQAVGIGATLPPALVGSRRSAAALPLGPLRVPDGRLGASLRTLYGAGGAYPSPTLSAIAGVDADYLTVADRLGPVLMDAQPSDPAAEDPGAAEAGGARGGTDLAGQLEVVSRLVRAGVPTQAYAVSLGGFDTHSGEAATHARLLGVLDSALDGFLASVESSPHAQRLVVLVHSEFGRRVVLNASGGTDHGTAAPVIAVGPGVRGGLYGEQPSLTRLGTGADEGDLVATTDFRDVYATVLGSSLGSDPEPVVGPGRRSLGFVQT